MYLATIFYMYMNDEPYIMVQHKLIIVGKQCVLKNSTKNNKTATTTA